MARRKKNDTVDPLRGGAIHVPRSRGAVSGVLLIVLGAFGALVPLLGPLFDFGLSPKKTWQLTSARFWLEILPGAVAVVGGLLLLLAANRIITSLGAWLGVAAGAWFVVGRDLASLLHIGSPGTALSTTHKGLAAIETLACFTGLGALILFVASFALGRLSVRSVRDVRAAQHREMEDEIERRRQEDYQLARAREVSENGSHDEAERAAQLAADNVSGRVAHDAAQQASERSAQQIPPQQIPPAQFPQQPAAQPYNPPQQVPPQGPPSGGATRS